MSTVRKEYSNFFTTVPVAIEVGLCLELDAVLIFSASDMLLSICIKTANFIFNEFNSKCMGK